MLAGMFMNRERGTDLLSMEVLLYLRAQLLVNIHTAKFSIYNIIHHQISKYCMREISTGNFST